MKNNFKKPISILLSMLMAAASSTMALSAATDTATGAAVEPTVYTNTYDESYVADYYGNEEQTKESKYSLETETDGNVYAYYADYDANHWYRRGIAIYDPEKAAEQALTNFTNDNARLGSTVRYDSIDPSKATRTFKVSLRYKTGWVRKDVGDGNIYMGLRLAHLNSSVGNTWDPTVEEICRTSQVQFFVIDSEVSNWTNIEAYVTFTVNSLDWQYGLALYLDGAGEVYLDDITITDYTDTNAAIANLTVDGASAGSKVIFSASDLPAVVNQKKIEGWYTDEEMTLPFDFDSYDFSTGRQINLYAATAGVVYENTFDEEYVSYFYGTDDRIFAHKDSTDAGGYEYKFDAETQNGYIEYSEGDDHHWFNRPLTLYDPANALKHYNMQGQYDDTILRTSSAIRYDDGISEDTVKLFKVSLRYNCTWLNAEEEIYMGLRMSHLNSYVENDVNNCFNTATKFFAISEQTSNDDETVWKNVEAYVSFTVPSTLKSWDYGLSLYLNGRGSVLIDDVTVEDYGTDAFLAELVVDGESIGTKAFMSMDKLTELGRKMYLGGWYTDENMTEVFDAGSYSFPADRKVTLYAKYVPPTVGFDIEDGVWYYTLNGERVKATDLVEYEGTRYFVENGVVNFDAVTLYEQGGTWYYVEKGVVNPDATTVLQINVTEHLTDVTVPEGITTIGEFAFSACDNLTSVILPETVTNIGDWAFNNCGKLSSINIPVGVNRIGYMTFYGCSSLTGINLSETVESIDYNAFADSGLTSIVIPDGCNSIGDGAFAECKNLTSVTIPESVTKIGENAFYNCIGLTVNCYNNSAAHSYAVENNIPYNIIKRSVAAPDAPKAESVADNSVTLTATEGCEYKMDDGEWQDSNVFNNLNPNEKHTFYQRIKETNETYASEQSSGTEITTDKMSVAAPSAPTLETKTYNSVTLKNVAGCEYSMNGTDWQSSNVFKNLNPKTEYTFYQRTAETQTAYASETSAALKVTTNEMPPKESLINENGVWYYVRYGEMVNATTLVNYYGVWYYVENGKVNFNATTLCKYYDTWYYVEKGKVNFNATTLCKYYDTWYYVEKGKANFNATTLCKYGSIWYYVEKGKANFNATTLFKYGSTWYYVEKGKVNFNATTLCKYGSTWYYVEKGKINFNATTLCKYGNTWYYVEKGKVNFNATTLCKYGSTWYYVEKGKVNFNATTLCKYGNTWYYVEKGKVNFKANLSFKYYGKYYNVKGGIVKN